LNGKDINTDLFITVAGISQCQFSLNLAQAFTLRDILQRTTTVVQLQVRKGHEQQKAKHH